MRIRIVTALQPFCLAILVSVMPVAWATASEAPVGNGLQQELKAVERAVEHVDVGDDAIIHGPKALAHGEAQGNSLSADKLKDLFWRAANFLALVVLLVKFGAKPISSALSGRQQQVKEELEDLVVRRDAAEKSYQEFETRLAGMEQEMEAVVQRAIAQAQTEKERILADAEKAAADIMRQAEAAVQAELEDAKRLLREEIAEQAAAMAEELIVKNLTTADQMAITEQYLERVGAVQ